MTIEIRARCEAQARQWAFTLICALLLAPAAQASCGVSFCAVNTLWEAQGTWNEPGARLDVRFEYIDQDQPRMGREAVNVGHVRKHHDEVRTLNRNLVTALDYSFDPRWAMSVQLPFVTRTHSHIHHHGGAQIHDSWNLDSVGDLRVLARRQLWQQHDSDFGVSAGLKLPTGDYKQANDSGQLAERSLQAGSGTTDAIAGVHYNALLTHGDAPLRGFTQAQVQYALDEHKGYRPGYQYSADAGLAYGLNARWSALLQLNTQVKGRDRGDEGEPRDSGGSFVWLSPGASFGLGENYRLYGFVQLPLYQRVNGIQLTADVAYVMGMNVRF